jgi:hypothetical protein
MDKLQKGTKPNFQMAEDPTHWPVTRMVRDLDSLLSFGTILASSQNLNSQPLCF